MTAALVVRRPQGLYCPQGDFYIDPWRRVERAVITHAHADHARSGHGHYLCAARGADVLRARLGAGISLQGLAWGESVTLGGVRLSLHPAGHILGSAQVRLEAEGQVWVVAGDYFVSVQGDVNPTCDAFEPVRCDCFVTEATFGAPIYRWPRHATLFDDIAHWWQGNAAAGELSVLQAYSLGKTQHLLAGLGDRVERVYVHPAAQAINAAYSAAGVRLPPAGDWADLAAPAALRGALVIAPPQGQAPWQWQPGLVVRTAFASGWMQTHAGRHRAGLDRGFVLSDHADWPGLLMAVQATGCTRVIVTHGDEALLVRRFTEMGLDCGTFSTEFDATDDSHPSIG